MKNIIPALVACMVVLIAVGFYFIGTKAADGETSREIVERCQDTEDKSACYEREVPVLYPQFSVEEIFEIIRGIRRSDSEYQFCHVLAHKVGERIVAEDPEKWIDAIPLNPPDGMCSNGFIHGVVGGRFRAEVLSNDALEKLVPEFSRACEARGNWQPSDLDRAICYHGLGHLYDFITDADLPKALDMCERTAPEDLRRVCREGVFMQIYQPLEPDDYLMIDRMPVKPSTTTVRAFCSRFERDEYEGACLRESWPYFRGAIRSGEGAEDFCSGQPNADEESHCYETATAIIGRTSLDHLEQAGEACSYLPRERQLLCYRSVAQAVLEEDRNSAARAVQFCMAAPGTIADQCIQELVGRSRFIFGENRVQLEAFCEAVPPKFTSSCPMQAVY